MTTVDIVFRVDADPGMGMGHLMRCLALAQGLLVEQASLSVVFVMRSETAALAQCRNDWVGEVELLPASLKQQQEPQWLAQYCQAQQVRVLVLDGYQFSGDYRQDLSQTTQLLKVVFDDNNNSGPLCADVVINGASNAAQLAYNLTAPQATLCIGEQYRILRQEFCQPQISSPWSQRDKLVLVMGGSDPYNLTQQILQGLAESGFQDKLTVVTGSAYQNRAALRQTIQQSVFDIEHIENCQQMAMLFAQSRLVVSAAGGTQFELLACRTPSLLLVVADNQLNATQEARKQGWCESIDARLGDNTKQIVSTILALWSAPQRLQYMHQQSQQWADTQGTSRVVRQILTLVAELKYA